MVQDRNAIVPPAKRVREWLRTARRTGGFLDYWRKEFSDPELSDTASNHSFDDSEAFFLFCLVNRINSEVLQSDPSCGDVHWLINNMLLRSNVAPEGSEIDQRIVSDLKPRISKRWAEKLALEEAVQNVSTRTFAGDEILFSDARAKMDADLEKVADLVALFKRVAKRHGVSRISLREAGQRAALQSEELVRRYTNEAMSAVYARDGKVTESMRQLFCLLGESPIVLTKAKVFIQ